MRPTENWPRGVSVYRARHADFALPKIDAGNCVSGYAPTLRRGPRLGARTQLTKKHRETSRTSER